MIQSILYGTMATLLKTMMLIVAVTVCLTVDVSRPELAVIVVIPAIVVGLFFFLATDKEPGYAVARISTYAGAAVTGWFVFYPYPGYWASYLSDHNSNIIFAYLASIVDVHERLKEIAPVPVMGYFYQFIPWGAVILMGFGALGVCAELMLFINPPEKHQKRKRSKSDLYGNAKLMEKKDMRKLSEGPGIILGQESDGKSSRLVSYPLEGHMFTFAIPRSGKTSLVSLNLLDPNGKFFKGSTIIIDPRGENYCVAANRRQQMGRDVVLMDPFREVDRLCEENKGKLCVPSTRSHTYNPLDFIREGTQAISDIDILLDAILTKPTDNASSTAEYFYKSSRAIIGGYIAWVRFTEPPERKTLQQVRAMFSYDEDKRNNMLNSMRTRTIKSELVGYGLPADAAERVLNIEKKEFGSTYNTIANHLDFLKYPEVKNVTSDTSFDPITLTNGNTDVFVVVPEPLLEHVKAWLRLWITIPNAVASRATMHNGLLIIIDEMPKIGYLQPVMDAYAMGAGKGIRFWCFAQAKSYLEQSYGVGNTKILFKLAEVIQVFAAPRADDEFAEEISKAIGDATFETPTHSVSGSMRGDNPFYGNTSSQEGFSQGLVKERIVSPDAIKTMGGFEQYVITGNKDVGKEAIHMFISRYWERKDSKQLACPNPYALPKEQKGGKQLQVASKPDMQHIQQQQPETTVTVKQENEMLNKGLSIEEHEEIHDTSCGYAVPDEHVYDSASVNEWDEQNLTTVTNLESEQPTQSGHTNPNPAEENKQETTDKNEKLYSYLVDRIRFLEDENLELKKTS